ncbi:8-oxoguanine DNA glycosylase OGG fold protein [Actinophytocola algeriensis]|uniref:Uncharacterized protein n=1 Tax=Actinophytocola algeriensis TaxID=1768010 RepID=A0A7W7VBL6_9PSEU|nr:hypothetical protein [Actinophytocola algeriensis]MBB4904096.1 hypothetical protein [Actinophytocola algeriensis]MBE1477047.1 hypothetical protein [Actinophytocola algeriensis]
MLAQGIRFDPARWRRLLPDSALWPAELDGANVVTRETVFAVCGNGDVTRGLVAACVWGAGTGAQSVHRRAKVFTHNELNALGFRLAAALELLRESGPVAAYDALRTRFRIAYLGPAFFTKFLYFAGYDTGSEPRPLILDRFVARGLAAGWPRTGWTGARYGEYLRHAHAWAHESGAAPDAVELALFRAGKAYRSGRLSRYQSGR